MSFKFSHDKDGRVTQVIDGEGVAPNQYVIKLQHENGSVSLAVPCPTFIIHRLLLELHICNG